MSAAGSFATVGAGWRKPIPEVRLLDDEIAVASVLELMCRYVEDGAGFYELAEAAPDHYLYLCPQEVAEWRASARSSRQPWDDQLGERGAGVPPPSRWWRTLGRCARRFARRSRWVRRQEPAIRRSDDRDHVRARFQGVLTGHAGGG
jgi:hypothetical protein